MIKELIKVLIVEDNPNDAKLIDYHIRKIVTIPEIMMVDTFENFEENLQNFDPDIIISDYKMNGFTGMDVLRYTIKNSTVSHFIFITGTLYDEELAAETILTGATGYILKKHMKQLNIKLRPHFENFVENKRFSDLPKDSKKMFDEMQLFIENLKQENQAHMESYNQIKSAIDKYHSLKDTDDA